jgi:DNA-directed RNA polymerase subunit H
MLVPKHEIMTISEAEQVLEKYHCKPTELPLIFVNDPAIVGLGVKPGDMIKITRKSATAGESFYYRYVIEV